GQITTSKHASLTHVGEADTAAGLDHDRATSLRQAVSVSTAHPTTTRRQTMTGLAGEHSTPYEFRPLLGIPLAGVAESNASWQQRAVKRRRIGLGDETGIAQGLAAVRRWMLAVAGETATAAVTGAEKTRGVGRAGEVSAGAVIAAVKRVTAGLAGEASTAGPIVLAGSARIGLAVHANTAGSMGRVRDRLLAQAVEATTTRRVFRRLPVGVRYGGATATTSYGGATATTSYGGTART